ncbi:MAG: hypothetical protein LBV20_01505 [Treponema sp.]|jgi:hypothetical protein|nr:hypothetical protein [Treponema sp.]
MKHNKIVFLIGMSVIALLFFSACYPPSPGPESQYQAAGDIITISYGPSSIKMGVGDMFDLADEKHITVLVKKEDGTEGDINDVMLSVASQSKDGVVSLSGTKITGTALGEALIKIKSDTSEDAIYFPVNVRRIDVSSSSGTISSKMTNGLQMTASLYPGDEDLAKVDWSVDDIGTDGVDSDIDSAGILTTTRTGADDGDAVDVIASATFGETLTAEREAGHKTITIANSADPIVVIKEGGSGLAAVGQTLTLNAEAINTADVIQWSLGNTTIGSGPSINYQVAEAGNPIITASAGGASATFTLNARSLTIGPNDASLSISALGTLLGGLLGLKLGGTQQLTATIGGGALPSSGSSTAVWRITEDSTLSLLTAIEISQSGYLSLVPGLLNLTGVLSIGEITVEAKIPNTNLVATKTIPVTSVL